MFEKELHDIIVSSPKCNKVFGNRVFTGIAPDGFAQKRLPFIVSCCLSRSPINRNVSGKNTSFLSLYQIDILGTQKDQLDLGENAIQEAVSRCNFVSFTLRTYNDSLFIGLNKWLRSSSDLIVTF